VRGPNYKCVDMNPLKGSDYFKYDMFPKTKNLRIYAIRMILKINDFILRLQVVTAACIKHSFLGYFSEVKFADVSDVLAASIFRAMSVRKTSNLGPKRRVASPSRFTK
jgi:hypothetical protein